LEKSRVVSVSPGERNFHIFYQLLAGMPAKQLQDELYLSNDASKYYYLNRSTLVKVGTINDSEDYREVQKAFKSLQFSDGEIKQARNTFNLTSSSFSRSILVIPYSCLYFTLGKHSLRWTPTSWWNWKHFCDSWKCWCGGYDFLFVRLLSSFVKARFNSSFDYNWCRTSSIDYWSAPRSTTCSHPCPSFEAFSKAPHFFARPRILEMPLLRPCMTDCSIGWWWELIRLWLVNMLTIK